MQDPKDHPRGDPTVPPRPAPTEENPHIHEDPAGVEEFEGEAEGDEDEDEDLIAEDVEDDSDEAGSEEEEE